jgi:2'-5' RNA ligase
MKKKGQSSLLHPSSLIPHPLIRVFCAVELPAEIRRRVGDHIADLRSLMPQARASWDHSDKLHITLKFLGEIEQERAAFLEDAAARAAQSVSPFSIIIEGAGAFPPRGLQLGLENECETAGFAREARPFHPHLTIARLRCRPEGARSLAALHHEKGFAPAEVSVNHLILMRSRLGPGGSTYTELSRHELGKR